MLNSATHPKAAEDGNDPEKEALAKRAESLKRELASTKVELEESRQHLQEQNEELNALSVQESAFNHEQKESLERQLGVVTAELEQVSDELSECREQMKRQGEELEASRSEVCELLAKQSSSPSAGGTAAIDELEKQLAAAVDELEAKEEQLEKANNDMTLLQDYGVQMMEKEAASDTKLADMSAQVEALKKELSVQGKQLMDAQESKQSKLRRSGNDLEVAALTNDLEECRQELVEKDAELDMLRGKLQEATSGEDVLDEEGSSLQPRQSKTNAAEMVTSMISSWGNTADELDTQIEVKPNQIPAS